MHYPLKQTEYKKIVAFLHDISPKTNNLREQIQLALSSIWGYNHTLFWISSNDGSIYDPELYGIKQQIIYEYKDYYEDLDLLHPKKLLKNIPEQRIFNFTNVHSHTHFYESDFYTDFFNKHHFIDEMAVNFVHDNKLIATLGILRKKDEQKFSTEDIKRFEAIYQFISQKLFDYMQIEQQTIENQLYRKRMDESNDGYLLLNQQHDIIYQNASAQQILAKMNQTDHHQHLSKLLITNKRTNINKPLHIQAGMQNYTVTILNETNMPSITNQQPYYLIHFKQKETKHMCNTTVSKQFLLTKREAEICHLLTKGFTNKEVATELFISINTVKKHIQNIYDKLSVRNRSQLAKKLLHPVT